MTRFDGRPRLLAIVLAILAGYVDAIGLLQLGGLFASSMGGNTTRLAIGVVGDPGIAATAAGLVLAFVAGIIAATTMGTWAGVSHRSIVLMLVAALLAIAAMLDAQTPGQLAPLALAAAMGAANCVFSREGEIGMIVVTNTLVRLGQGIAATLMGAGGLRWLLDLLLWLGLVFGACGGGLAYLRWGANSLLLAAAVAVLLAMLTRRSAAARAGPT